MKRQVDEIADELLVLSAQGGDNKSLQLLVRRWQARLFRHACQITGRREVASDVVQEAWIGIIRGIGRLKDPAAFRGWAYRIVHHRAVDWVRRQKKHRDTLGELGEQSPTGAARHQDAASNEDELEQLRSAISRLDPDEKLLLRMYYTDEMRIKEIARSLSIPAGTVKFRLFKTRQHLKSLIERSR